MTDAELIARVKYMNLTTERSSPLDMALAAIDAKHCDEFVRAKARGLIRGYDARWASDDWESVAIEQQFQLPIINPESGKPSRTFRYAGKRDGLIRYIPANKLWLREGKTCSEDIADGAAPYWRRLTIDAQVSIYVLSQWQEGTKVDGTLYDVIRKPSIRPKEIAKAQRQHIVADGTYCGSRISMETREAMLQRENGELFEARIASDCLERPAWYFQRRSIPRIDADVHEFAIELWDTADEIRLARLRERHTRNSGACMTWNRPCQFLGICSGCETVDSDKWQKRNCVHDELELAGDGRDLLTHSRMQTFRTCRRKHYYGYELGIERVDEDEAEALYFGQLIHHALEAWWSFYLPTSENDHEHRNSGPAVSEAAGPDCADETTVVG